MSTTPTPALTPESTELANLKRKCTAQYATCLGRGLRQIIHDFADSQDLVARSDGRTGLLTSGEDVEPSPEEDALYRLCMELIKMVPLLKLLLDQSEEGAIAGLNRNLCKRSDVMRGDDTAGLRGATAG
ncbi:hypothetical protein HWV62_27480 [Athelia sp. TMB]|nr:hypothetical protein HWV62_27480 [Athelia sp. TMB]